MRRGSIVLLLAATARAGNDASQWIWFPSRESPEGPRLVLVSPDGKTRTFPNTEDTVPGWTR